MGCFISDRLVFMILSLFRIFSHFEIENGSRHVLHLNLSFVHVFLKLFLSLLFIIDRPIIIRKSLLLEKKGYGLLAEWYCGARVRTFASLRNFRFQNRRHGWIKSHTIRWHRLGLNLWEELGEISHGLQRQVAPLRHISAKLRLVLSRCQLSRLIDPHLASAADWNRDLLVAQARWWQELLYSLNGGAIGRADSI